MPEVKDITHNEPLKAGERTGGANGSAVLEGVSPWLPNLLAGQLRA